MVRVSPAAYNSAVDTYKNPVVGLMEVGLVAAVAFHALNGVRILLIDFWSRVRASSGRCATAWWRSGSC